MSDTVVKQIAVLHRQSVPELKERWRELFGTEAPAYNRAFLIKRLAYRLQELTHGGLPAAAQAKMRDILREAGLTEDGLTPGTGRLIGRRGSRPILGRRSRRGAPSRGPIWQDAPGLPASLRGRQRSSTPT